MAESDRQMHPAIAVVLSGISANDGRARVMGSVIREEDGAVAVVVHTDHRRYVIVVLREGDCWLEPGLVFSGVLPNPDRLETNSPMMPLAQQSGDIRSSLDGEFVWYAVVGTAALDAISVRVLTTLESRYPGIGDGGLVLELVRAQRGERPLVTVTTRDGREESDYREE
ncbi:hypothetical protein ACFVUS_31245 [Nocardia sp. NPDC058058]|uniref:hypothetical protein n=1 Tax=Nocardia sp. NPDC058058 TaxID=3346317 RepID=UPI0036D83174